jgi:hypothetical protein
MRVRQPLDATQAIYPKKIYFLSTDVHGCPPKSTEVLSGALPRAIKSCKNFHFPVF